MVSIVLCDDSISEVESMLSSIVIIIFDLSEGDLIVESRYLFFEKILSGYFIKEINEIKCLEEDLFVYKE